MLKLIFLFVCIISSVQANNITNINPSKARGSTFILSDKIIDNYNGYQKVTAWNSIYYYYSRTGAGDYISNVILNGTFKSRGTDDFTVKWYVPYKAGCPGSEGTTGCTSVLDGSQFNDQTVNSYNIINILNNEVCDINSCFTYNNGVYTGINRNSAYWLLTCTNWVSDCDIDINVNFTFKINPTYIPSSCTNVNCLNGGTCIVSNGIASCYCINGYTGTDCSTPPVSTSCTNVNCLHGGTCVLANGIASCSCTSGYSGTDCSTVSDSSLCTALTTCTSCFTSTLGCNSWCGNSGNSGTCSYSTGYQSCSKTYGLFLIPPNPSLCPANTIGVPSLTGSNNQVSSTASVSSNQVSYSGTRRVIDSVSVVEVQYDGILSISSSGCYSVEIDSIYTNMISGVILQGTLTADSAAKISWIPINSCSSSIVLGTPLSLVKNAVTPGTLTYDTINSPDLHIITYRFECKETVNCQINLKGSYYFSIKYGAQRSTANNLSISLMLLFGIIFVLLL